MAHSDSAPEQLNPLLPGYSFNLFLVAGVTPIIQNGPLDFFIDRPNGMNGYIINMTIRGQGKVFDGENSFLCNPGDLLLFPPDAVHYYGRAPGQTDWYHRWVYFRPRAYWSPWLEWRHQVNKVGRLTLNERNLIAEFDALFQQIDTTHKEGRPTSEELAMNLLERLLIRSFEETPENSARQLDPRIHKTCQFLSRNLAAEIDLEEIAAHVCLSPSRLAHLFRQQVGVSIVRWREDQRIILAKHLLQNSLTPISAIADLVGYPDQLYFSRVFRKRVGSSPSSYRKDCAQAPQRCGDPLQQLFAQPEMADSGYAMLNGELPGSEMARPQAASPPANAFPYDDMREDPYFQI